MSVSEAAKFYGVSRSTIYRWLKKKSGKVRGEKIDGRWHVWSGNQRRAKERKAREEGEMEWPAGVDVKHAREAGRKPEDFRYEQWPVSNVRLHQPRFEMPKEVALTYRCDIPADTPQANQYDENDRKIPDPKGMCLAHVDFQLVDVDTQVVLDEALGGGHVAGDVRAFLSGPCRFWDVLKPGRTLKVRLFASPEFFFLNEQGGMVGYANTPNGQFVGAKFQSRGYILSMDHDRNIFVDGEGRPAPPAPEHEGLAEYEQQIQAEEAERKRIERELEARLAREERERKERWAREDAAREEENRRALAKAEAERKRNAPYIQNRPEETIVQAERELLEIYDFHLKGMPGGEEKWRSYLQAVSQSVSKPHAAAARKIAANLGWTI